MGNFLVDEPLHMSMGKLGGITFGLAGNGLDAKLVNLSGGSRRKQDPESQTGKKGKPEGIVLIDIQDPGDADYAPGRFLFIQRLVPKVSFQFIIE